MDAVISPSARVVIVTGMSGAGKTVAVQHLEDLGFFCVDNLPPILIPKFAELIQQSQGRINKVALVIDMRGREFFATLEESMKSLREQFTIPYEILFLDANDNVLVQRYKETRRKHPLAKDGSLVDGIQAERLVLEDLRRMSDVVIDTSQMKPLQLKERLASVVTGSDETSLAIHFVSFGFKYGVPIDADLMFDVRFLPNPHYIPELKPQTGQHPDVYEYVMKWSETQQFLAKFQDMLNFLIPQYKKEGKSQLIVGIGCTGGKHRSVAVAEYMFKTFSNSETEQLRIGHRDKDKDRA